MSLRTVGGPAALALLVLVGTARPGLASTSTYGNPTVATNDAGVGTFAWQEQVPPTTSAMTSAGQTNYIKFSGFGFNVPADAVILRIIVYISRYDASGTSLLDAAFDASVRLMKDGVLVGPDLASATAWPGFSNTAQYFDGSDPLWGTTWTAADINDSDFGVALSAQSPDAVSDPTIDIVQIRVDYFGCPTQAIGSCYSYYKGAITIDESKPGKEKISVKMSGGDLEARQTAFGDPSYVGGTAYSLCFYDSTGDLAGGVQLDRAGDTCGDDPCWSYKELPYPDAKSMSYSDKAQTSYGVKSLKIACEETKAKKITLKASNTTGTLPLGIAANLAGHSLAFAQLFASDEGECHSLPVTNIKEATTLKFKGKPVSPF